VWQPQSARHTPFTAMRSSAQAAEGLQRRPMLKRANSDGLGSAQGESHSWPACGKAASHDCALVAGNRCAALSLPVASITLHRPTLRLISCGVFLQQSRSAVTWGRAGCAASPAWRPAQHRCLPGLPAACPRAPSRATQPAWPPACMPGALPPAAQQPGPSGRPLACRGRRRRRGRWPAVWCSVAARPRLGPAATGPASTAALLHQRVRALASAMLSLTTSAM